MGAGPVTTRERRRARELDGDVTRLQGRGVLASARIGQRLMGRVASAYRAGHDPTPLVWSAFASGVDDVAGGMLAAHLAGRAREREQARQEVERRPALALSSGVYWAAVAVLRRRLKLTPEELAALEEQYQAEAIRVLRRAAFAVEQRLQRVLLMTAQEGLAVREGVRAL